MERYEGLSGNDAELHGGGAFVDKYGYGHEIFNFKKIRGKVYGFAQQKGRNDLKRLGAKPTDDYLNNVLVIFTATHKDGGTYVVGWYKNAKVYREYQNRKLRERRFGNEYIGYYVEVNAENATLLSEDERTSFPRVPRVQSEGKGAMGQANIWYAESDLGKAYKKEILKKIEGYEINKADISQKKAVIRTANIERKKKVEKIAVKKVTEVFIERGFDVNSVESKNLGWDLEAKNEKTELRIEVKGLSGADVSVEVSYNEYKNMKKYKESYRLCVVINCLKSPLLYTFAYSHEKKCWLDEDGNILNIEEILLARCKL
jgi:hypothetical protein